MCRPVDFGPQGQNPQHLQHSGKSGNGTQAVPYMIEPIMLLKTRKSGHILHSA